MVELRTLLELRQATPLSFFGDGLTLLVGSDLPGTRQLFLADVEGGGLTQLTDFDEPVRGQALADGRILLEMDEGGNERTQLFLLDAEPGAVPERLVVDPHFMHRSPCVDPDGTLVAYVTNRRNGVDFDVVVRTLATGEEQVFERGGWWDTVGISPDGRWVAALRLGERAGDSDLYLFNAASRKVVHATPHTGEAEYGAPAWLPDSSAFFAATSEGRDTLAIGRYELESGEWSTVVESAWDLDCVIDRVGRTLLVSANEDGRSTLQLRDPRTLELREEVFAAMKTSAGAPFVICVPSVPELPNEYVLLESICGRTVVIDEPAKTVIPAVACPGLAAAPPAASDAHRTTIASNEMRRENRRVGVDRIRDLVDGERRRERKAEGLAAQRRREVGGVLRLAGGDAGQTCFEAVGLHSRDRAEIGPEHRALELPRERDDRLLAGERSGRVAERDVAGHRGRLAGAADDRGDRLIVRLLVGVGALQVSADNLAGVRRRDRLRIEVRREQLDADQQPRVREIGRRHRVGCRHVDEAPERRTSDQERGAALCAPGKELSSGDGGRHVGELLFVVFAAATPMHHRADDGRLSPCSQPEQSSLSLGNT